MCQAQIKIIAIISLQELQSSVWPGPRYGPVGCRRLKSGLFNRYVIVGISDVFGHNHADLQSVTPALAHDPSVNYSTAPHPKRRGLKRRIQVRKKIDKRMRQVREKNVWVTLKGNIAELHMQITGKLQEKIQKSISDHQPLVKPSTARDRRDMVEETETSILKKQKHNARLNLANRRKRMRRSVVKNFTDDCLVTIIIND